MGALILSELRRCHSMCDTTGDLLGNLGGGEDGGAW